PCRFVTKTSHFRGVRTLVLGIANLLSACGCSQHPQGLRLRSIRTLGHLFDPMRSLVFEQRVERLQDQRLVSCFLCLSHFSLLANVFGSARAQGESSHIRIFETVSW